MTKRQKTTVLTAAVVLALAGSLAPRMAGAASATWNGTTDGVWATDTNWSVTPAPGTGDTATFSNTGGGNTTIDLGGGVTVKTITFDTNAGAYIIGAGAVGSQTLTLNDTGAVTMAAVVGNNQTVNANLVLGTSATASSYTFTNNSPTNSLTFAGTISGGSGGTAGTKTLTVNSTANTYTTISGAIQNGGATVALTMSGGGTLTLSGVNTYTGATTLSKGNLVLDAAGADSASKITVSGTGNLTQTATNAMTGTASLTVSAGTATLSQSNNYTGSTSLTGGVLNLSATGAISGGTFTVNGTGVLNESVANAISGNAALTVSGGTLTLTQTNNFTGTTTVSGGTLNLNTTGAISGTASALSGGTLNLNAMGAISTGTLTVSGTGILAESVANGISGNAALTVTGTGAVTLTQSNNYTGLTSVTLGGSLTLGTGGSLPTGGNLTVSNGSTKFDLNGQDQSLGLVNLGTAATITNNSQTPATLTMGNGSVSSGTFAGKLNVIFNNGASSSNFGGSSAWTNTGDITLNANSSGSISLQSVNNVGMIVNSGTGTANVSLGSILSNVMGVVQNSAKSTLQLGGTASTFTSGVTIKNGTVILNTTAGASTGVITLGDSTGSANTYLQGISTFVYTNPINVAAGSTGMANLGVSGGNSPNFAGAITLHNDLTIIPGNAITVSGGITGTGNVYLAAPSTGTISVTTNPINNDGKIINSGTGSATSTISGGIGANVRQVVQNSTTSQLTISTTPLTVNGTYGTALVNNVGTKILSLQSGTIGTGDLIVNNNNSTAAGVEVKTGLVNHTGKIINTSTGTGAITFSAPIGSNVNGITQSSTMGAFTVSSNMTLNASLGMTISTDGTQGLTLSGGITGPGTITNVGSGSGVTTISGTIGSGVTQIVQNSATSQLTLSGANTAYGNGLLIKNGTILLNNTTAAGTGTITLGDSVVNSNSASLLAAGTSLIYTNPVNVVAGSSGALAIGSSGSANPTFSGAITINNNNIVLSNAAGQLYVTGGITGKGNVTISQGSTNAIGISTAAVNNDGTITLVGSGIGGVTISGGVGANVKQIDANNSSGSSSTFTISTVPVTINGTVGTILSSTSGSKISLTGGTTGTGDLYLNNNSATDGAVEIKTSPLNHTGKVICDGTGTGYVTIGSTAVIGSTVTEFVQKSNTSKFNFASGTTFNLNPTTGITFTNNSSQSMTVGGIFNGNTGAIIFTGTGAGSSSLNSALTSGISVVQNQANSLLSITNSLNTFTGGITIKNGSVYIWNTSSASTGTITFGDATGGYTGTLLGSTQNYINPITVASGGNSVFTLGATTNCSVVYSGAVTLNNNLCIGNNYTVTVSGGITGTGNVTFTASGANTATISTLPVNNNGKIINAGTGSGIATVDVSIGSNVTDVVQDSATSQLSLNKANSFNGNLIVKKGTAFLANATAASSGAVTLGDTASGATGNATLLSQTLTINNNINVVAGSSGVLTLGSNSFYAPTYNGQINLANNLTLASSGTTSQLYIKGGISGTGNVTISESSSNALTISGAAVNPDGTITVTGTGTGTTTISANIGGNVKGITQNSASSKLVLSGTNSFSGGITVNTGEVDVTTGVTGTTGSLPYNSSVTVDGSATGSVFKLTTGAKHDFTKMTALTVDSTMGTATLNLTTHDVLATTGNLVEVSKALVAPSIPSGTTATMTTGILVGSDWNKFNANAQFHGLDVVADALVLKYTYAGDANLDGQITMDDYLQIDAGYLFDGQGWVNGDFNHDGAVNAADYVQIDQNFRYQNGAAAEEMINLHAAWFGAEYTQALEALNAVPEPTSLGLLGLGVVGLLRRRERR